MNEQQWQANVVDLAKMNGWYLYHTYDSRRSNPGFPDLVLVHPFRQRVLFRELKTDGGRVSTDQLKWIGILGAAGADVEVWRPSDLERIAKQLGGIR